MDRTCIWFRLNEYANTTDHNSYGANMMAWTTLGILAPVLYVVPFEADGPIGWETYSFLGVVPSSHNYE